MAYVKSGTYLDTILEKKVAEIAAAKAAQPEGKLVNLAKVACVPRDFTGALRRDTVALIAEVKHASPSRGVLIEDFDPVALGMTYAENGAVAISVLTDEPFFRGSLEHLSAVRGAVKAPVLRKDFIVDPYQVYQARAAEADAVLLIVAALEDVQLRELRALIESYGMTALVEVHDEAELDRALEAGALVIGVNNRDLKTFNVDLETTSRLANRVPDSVTLVAESGIKSAADVRRMGELGAHAVLVGESLVAQAANDLGGIVKDFSSQPRLTA